MDNGVAMSVLTADRYVEGDYNTLRITWQGESLVWIDDARRGPICGASEGGIMFKVIYEA